MPATRTRTQRPYVPYAYSSSSSESSVLDRRTPFPYIQIPKISLLDYGRILSEEDTFDEVMATIGHRRSLVNQSKTIQHLWLTSRRLLEEVNKQRHEARRIFARMKRMGLQQELYGSRLTASPVLGRSERSTPSVSPLSTQPSCSPLSSQFHSCEETVINDDLSDYHESEAPLAFLSSLPLPPLETIGNPIVVDDDEDDIDRLFSCPSYHEAQSTFTTPTLQLLYCQDCTNGTHYYFECPQYICDHCLMHAPHHRESNCPNR
jgi:hypothetical protein